MEERIVDFEVIEPQSHAGVFRAPEVASNATSLFLADLVAPSRRFRRPAESWDVFRISFDRSTGLVRAYAAGAWTVSETQNYLTGLAALVDESRALLGKARVLLDRREVSIQSPDVAALLAAANGEIFKPDDRIAIVVTTSVAKVSLRKRLPHPGSKAFLSIGAAETWLKAFEK